MMNNALLQRYYNWFIANFSIWNIFKISSMLKLSLIYVSGILWIIVIDFSFSQGFWYKLASGTLSKHRISIYSVQDRVGEGVLYHRLKNVADKKNIDYAAIRFPESLTSFWLTRHFYHVTTSLINYLFKPQFNLAVTHHVNIVPLGYNITYLNMPTSSLYNVDGMFKAEWQHLAQYDTYADLYTFVHGNNAVLAEALELSGNKNKKIIPFYIAQDYVPHNPSIDWSSAKAVITGTLWGCSRGSLRTVNALKMLAKDDLLVAYGVKDYLKFLGSAYKGSFETLGNVSDNIITIQQQHGIALIIHSLEHLLEGIPTSRILEAAAAGALIIADEHYFIQKFFGDNVLYFNALGDQQQIYKQIKAHVNWARTHPQEAAEKAKASHDIFAEHFIMENQLDLLFNLPCKPN